MSDQETININVATAEGRELLAQLAAHGGPVFRVRHACDFTDNDAEVVRD